MHYCHVLRQFARQALNGQCPYQVTCAYSKVDLIVSKGWFPSLCTLDYHKSRKMFETKKRLPVFGGVNYCLWFLSPNQSYLTLAGPGKAAGACLPKRPDSFIFNFLQRHRDRPWRPPTESAPPRETLDPPLFRAPNGIPWPGKCQYNNSYILNLSMYSFQIR